MVGSNVLCLSVQSHISGKGIFCKEYLDLVNDHGLGRLKGCYGESKEDNWLCGSAQY